MKLNGSLFASDAGCVSRLNGRLEEWNSVGNLPDPANTTAVSVWRRRMVAFMAANSALIAVACAQPEKPDAGGSAALAQSDAKTKAEVLRFLGNLRRIAVEDFLGTPRRIEDLMKFRIAGWRDSREDSEYFLSLVRTPTGSFAGLAAFMHRGVDGPRPILEFTPVRGSALQPRLTLAHVRAVFGEPTQFLPPSDFHRLSGGRLRFVIGSEKNMEVWFDVASSTDSYVSGIVLRRIDKQ